VQGTANDIMDALRGHFRGSAMQLVACPSPGRCQEGNVVVVNDEILVVRDSGRVLSMIDEELQKQREYKRLHPQEKKESIKVCFGPTCGQRKAREIETSLGKVFRQPQYRLMRCGCTGNCALSNNLVVNGNILHKQMPGSAARSVESELSRQRREKARNSGPISAEEAQEILGL